MLELEGTVQITSLDLLHSIFHLECLSGLPDLKSENLLWPARHCRPGVAVKVCSQPMFAEEQAGKPPVAEPDLQCQQGVADSE